jgi:DNA-binding transcriptional LysR family regulator
MDVEDLNWSDLKFFLVVARSGSLAKAAAQLGVNHSTVFRRISSFESATGVKLFVRQPEGYRLTEAGAEVCVSVERIAERIEEFQRFLGNRSDRPRGVINVTAPHNLAYRYLPNYVVEFHALYPNVHVNILVGNRDLNLSRREADLAIRATSAPPENLIGQKLLSLPWGAYAAEKYLAVRGTPANEIQLAEHDIVSVNGALRLPAFEWVERNIPAERIIGRCSDLMCMSALAVAGLGIALLPDDQAKPELRRLFTFEPGRFSDIWLLSHPDLRDNQWMRLFREFLVERFREDATLGSYATPRVQRGIEQYAASELK